MWGPPVFGGVPALSTFPKLQHATMARNLEISSEGKASTMESGISRCAHNYFSRCAAVWSQVWAQCAHSFHHCTHSLEKIDHMVQSANSRRVTVRRICTVLGCVPMPLHDPTNTPPKATESRLCVGSV